MKLILLLGAIVIIALVLKACISGNRLTDDTSRTQRNVKSQTLKENDKLIVVTNVEHQDISSALTAFCKNYNKEDFAALPRLFEVRAGTYAITFPYDTDFATYCFAVNFLKYPADIKWNANVRAWATTKQGDDWITEKSANKRVMLYLAEDDKEYDNVFLTTQDNVGYKLGFAVGEETQLLNVAKEHYNEPTVKYESLQGLKYEDFQWRIATSLLLNRQNLTSQNQKLEMNISKNEFWIQVFTNPYKVRNYNILGLTTFNYITWSMLEEQYSNINEAIISLLTLPWISDEVGSLIKLNYGEGTLCEINHICAYAANSHVWASDDYVDSFNKTIESVKLEYPYLTDEAVVKITNIAAYYWK